jgi:hypothetical protein
MFYLIFKRREIALIPPLIGFAMAICTFEEVEALL